MVFEGNKIKLYFSDALATTIFDETILNATVSILNKMISILKINVQVCRVSSVINFAL
jgi:hypothetical protein